MKVIAPNGLARDPWVDRIQFNEPTSLFEPEPRLNLAPAPLSLRRRLEQEAKHREACRQNPRLYLKPAGARPYQTICNILLDLLEGEPCFI
jgi:hypothetical protein